MLLMVEKGIRGGICHVIHTCAKANKIIELSYLIYLYTNNLYGLKNYLWMVLNEKKMSKFNENFIKNYDEFSKKGYFLEVDIEYPKDLHELPGDLPFLPERMKINQCNKLVWNLYDKINYVIHIRASNHGLISKKPNYDTTKWFSENLLAMEMKK